MATKKKKKPLIAKKPAPKDPQYSKDLIDYIDMADGAPPSPEALAAAHQAIWNSSSVSTTAGRVLAEIQAIRGQRRP